MDFKEHTVWENVTRKQIVTIIMWDSTNVYYLDSETNKRFCKNKEHFLRSYLPLKK